MAVVVVVSDVVAVAAAVVVAKHTFCQSSVDNGSAECNYGRVARKCSVPYIINIFCK